MSAGVIPVSDLEALIGSGRRTPCESEGTPSEPMSCDRPAVAVVRSIRECRPGVASKAQCQECLIQTMNDGLTCRYHPHQEDLTIVGIEWLGGGS